MFSKNSNYICPRDRDNEINQKIYSRNLTNAPLEPNLSTRPQSTKFNHFQVVDKGVNTIPNNLNQNKKENIYQKFDISSMFNPGNQKSPWTGFAYNINNESKLRNQIYALEKDSRGAFMPSSNSELFHEKTFENSDLNPTKFESLFKTENFAEFNPNIVNISTKLFNNGTRQDLRES